MLCVFSVSGKELLSIPSQELTNVQSLKQQLSVVCGVPRFRQQLLHNDSVLDDFDDNLKSVDNVQLLILPFLEPLDEVDNFYAIACEGLVAVADVEALLQRPQDPDVADSDGWTLLHCLAVAGDVHGMQLALEAGADKDLVNRDGKTALHLAAEGFSAHDHGGANALRLLLDARANKDAVDYSGSSALHRAAASNSNPQAARLLLEVGARTDTCPSSAWLLGLQLFWHYYNSRLSDICIKKLYC